jgi:hypothetical protein
VTRALLSNPAVVLGLALFGLARGGLRLPMEVSAAIGITGLVAGAGLWLWHSRRPGTRIARVLAASGLAPAAVVARGGGRYELRLPLGSGLKDARAREDAIEHALSAAVDWISERGRIQLRLRRHRLPEMAQFEPFLRLPGTGPLPIPIGLSADGSVHVELAECHHLLVGGHTGSGKTAFLRQAVAALATLASSDDLGLALIDLKGGVELGVFAGLPHLLAPVATGIEEASGLLAQLEAELDSRQDQLVARAPEAEAEGGLEGWGGRRLVVVVDELAELSPAEARDGEQRARRQAALASLSRLARLGRGLGIHLVLATQRPDADVIPGQIKANLPATLAFRVRSELNSRILLGDSQPQAAALPPVPGRALLQFGELVEVQVPFLARADARLLAQCIADGSFSKPAPSLHLQRRRLLPWFFATRHGEEAAGEDGRHGSRPGARDTGPRNCTAGVRPWL